MRLSLPSFVITKTPLRFLSTRKSTDIPQGKLRGRGYDHDDDGRPDSDQAKRWSR